MRVETACVVIDILILVVHLLKDRICIAIHMIPTATLYCYTRHPQNEFIKYISYQVANERTSLVVSEVNSQQINTQESKPSQKKPSRSKQRSSRVLTSQNRPHSAFPCSVNDNSARAAFQVNFPSTLPDVPFLYSFSLAAREYSINKPATSVETACHL